MDLYQVLSEDPRYLPTTHEKPHFFRCGTVVVIPQKKTAVAFAVCGNQTANTDDTVGGPVAVLCEKNSKMLQDHSLKVRKTCNTCDTCEKM